MFKIYKIIILLFFVFISLSVNAHVQHYEDLNRIEFDIYRNNNHIGTHIFSFEKSGNEITIKSEINFQIKKLGIVFYKYYAQGIEIYKGNRLIKFNSITDQNGKKNMLISNQIIIIILLMDPLIKVRHQPNT